MKNEKVLVQEQKSKLQPFPFIENEDYLLKLKNGNYVVAHWWSVQFALDFNGDFIEEKIESIVPLKDLGL